MLAALALPLQGSPPTPAELRATLEALRHGEPGQPAFEAALPRVPDLIRSDTDWFLAGGAHLAGLHGRRECVPALLEALAGGRARHASGTQALLDALIRLEVPVEPARLAVDPGHPSESLILLARDAQANSSELAALLETCAEDETARWAAACLLTQLRDPRVVEPLLASTDWLLAVTVRDPGSGASAGHGSAGRRVLASHPPWPPLFAYHLLLPEAHEPLAPIRFERVQYDRGLRVPAPLSRAQRHALRERLLGEWLSGADDIEAIRPDVELVLDWSGAEVYRRELRSAIDDLRARIVRVARALHERGLLEQAGDVAARTTIRVAVHDLREQGLGPLPRPELPGVAYD